MALAAFFLTYVAPCEFSSSSTSIFKAMVSADGRCLLRLERSAKEMLTDINTTCFGLLLQPVKL